VICPDCKTLNIAGAEFCAGCGSDLHALALPAVDDEFTAHLVDDRLGDLVARDHPVVGPRDPIALAVHLMQRQETGCVLVYENGKLAGILTERDVLLKAAGEKVDANAVTVREIMTPDPVVLREDDSLALALHAMSIGGFRHMPLITRDGRPRVISIRDVFRHISPFIPAEVTRA
jgi:CBS domain-containing protein